MTARLCLLAALVAQAGCSTRTCRSGTVLLGIDATAISGADAIDVNIDFGGGVTRTGTFPVGSGNGSVEIDFSGHYQDGTSINVTVVVRMGTTRLASGTEAITLAPSCTAAQLTLMFAGTDGGADLSGCEGGPSCATNQLCCPGVGCVDVSSDPTHCGSCSTGCNVGETCQGGVCACGASPACAAQHACCAGVCSDDDSCPCGGAACNAPDICCNTTQCLDPRSDGNNCGMCGNVCGANFTCSSGSCRCGATTCPTGDLCCVPGGCIDGMNDINNCGSCGKKCQPGETCSGGSCHCNAISCVVGQQCCSGTCPQLTDVNNCGGCGLLCSANETCSGTACLCHGITGCTGTKICCPMGCRDLTSNSSCGDCNAACMAGNCMLNGTIYACEGFPSNVPASALTGTTAWTISSPTTINTDTLAISPTQPVGVTIAKQGALTLITVANLNINATVTITGTLPLAIVSSGTIDVAAPIRADANLDQPGPGGITPLGQGQGAMSVNVTAGAGGAGYQTMGGDGGTPLSGNGGKGGSQWGMSSIPPWAPLLGGSPGATGDTGNPRGGGGCNNPAAFGAGGGALQLTAMLSITVEAAAYIDASGGGGGGGCMNISGGGAGGGSGGTLLIESPIVQVNGELHAEGGGGGSGCGNGGGDGQPGSEFTFGGGNVAGGSCPLSTNCDGGSGASRNNPTPGAGNSYMGGGMTIYGLGGGGGAAGFIYLRASQGNLSFINGQTFPMPVQRMDLPSVIP